MGGGTADSPYSYVVEPRGEEVDLGKTIKEFVDAVADKPGVRLEVDEIRMILTADHPPERVYDALGLSKKTLTIYHGGSPIE